MSLKLAARVAAVLLLLAFAAFTYPAADLTALATWLKPPLTGTPPAARGGLAWLHVEHRPGHTAYIADPQGRLVLLHGAVPAGLVDYWSGANPSNTNPAPFYPIDPAAYDGKCPSNSSLIAAPPLCQADIRQMAAFGFNSLRLPVSWSLLEPSRGQFNQMYLDRIAQVVEWARTAGMYVIISMHQDAFSRYVGRSNPPALPGSTVTDLWYDDGAPAWATFTDGFPSAVFNSKREVNPAVLEAASNFWYNRAGIQDEYIQTVAFLVRRFKDDSTVAGFGLYNEPWSGWNLPPGFEDLLLFPFYRRVIDAITGANDGIPCPTQVFMPAACGHADMGVDDRNHLLFLDTGLLREVTDFPTHLSLPLSSYPNLVLGLHTYTHGYTLDALADVPPDKASYPWGGYDQTYDLGEREARAINAALMVTEFGNDPKWDSLILTNELREQERHRVGFAFWTWMDNCGTGWGMADGIDCSASKRSTQQPSSGCFRPAREEQLARVYPSATADPSAVYRFDAASGAFTLHAAGNFGDLPTVVVIPPEVTGPVSVSGAVAGEPSISGSDGVRIVTVFPAGGAFSVEVAAAPQTLLPCASSPR